MLTFDVRTDCNNDIEIAISVPKVSRDRGLVVDCGQVVITTLHLSSTEARALVAQTVEELNT